MPHKRVNVVRGKSAIGKAKRIRTKIGIQPIRKARGPRKKRSI